MLEYNIPGREKIIVDNLCLDYNGTIAYEGKLIDNIKSKIKELSSKLNVYVLTADTYHTVEKECEGLGVIVKTFNNDFAGKCKEEIVKSLSGNTVVFGNGYNDIKMFDVAVLSIAVIDREGCCSKLLPYSDIVVNNSVDAFNLLLDPNKLKATLRN